MKAAATNRFVLDASVAVAWCFEDEATRFTENVLDLLSAGGEALVPSIWPVEVANALLIAERRNRIALAQVTAILQRIAGLYPDTTPPTWNSPCGKPFPWPRWMSICAAPRKPPASSCCPTDRGKGSIALGWRK
jgi:hypothetical protein